MKIKFIRLISFLAVFCALAGTAFAANIVEVDVEGTQVTAYVKGAGEVSGITAMLGKEPCGDVEFQTMKDSDKSIKTLLLVDNSLSIPKETRSGIKEQLKELAAARKDNDYFAVGILSEGITILQDFTKDYNQLKTAIDGIEHQDLETYITDALYDYLLTDPFAAARKDSFVRIVLISDGVDNKEDGYAKFELLSKLKAETLPIYTVGVENNSKGNAESLEQMAGLSRATGAASCRFSELAGDTASLSNLLEADWNNLVVSLDVPESAQDGSLQTLRLDLDDTPVTIDEVRMPQSEKGPEPEKPEPETIVIIPEPEETDFKIYIVIAVLATLLIIGIIVAVILAARAKKKKTDFRAMSEAELRAKIEEEQQQQGATVFVGGGDATEMSDDGTIGIWEEAQPTRMITLTDTHAPERRFQKPLAKSLVIGFARESDICISYDKSVSRKHCELIREEDDVFIVNHSQSNGTMLNGSRISSKMLVFDGSIIKMGRVEMRIEIN